jgi:hypothetical protein
VILELPLDGWWYSRNDVVSVNLLHRERDLVPAVRQTVYST